jgi:hypothetical protein
VYKRQPSANVELEINRLDNDFNVVPGVHKLDQGERVPGVSSGRAIDILTGKSATQLTLTQEQIEDGAIGVMRCALLLMKHYYPEEKLVRMFDGYGARIYTKIKAVDIVSDPEVFFEAKTLFRDDSVSRDARVLDQLERGLLTPEEAKERLAFSSGNTKFVMDKVAQIAHMQKLLQGVKDGKKIKLIPIIDDFEAAKRVFGEFARSDEFDEMDDLQKAYIQDILIALATHGQGDAAWMQQMHQRTIFPHVMDPQRTMQQAGEAAALTASAPAQQQLMNEHLETRQKAGFVDELQRMDARLGQIPGGSIQ